MEDPTLDIHAAVTAAAYMDLLVQSFNPATVPGRMCRAQLSVGWDGQLYDRDFNQVLELASEGPARTLWDLDGLDALAGRRVVTGAHCFACTAGSGSSCAGVRA